VEFNSEILFFFSALGAFNGLVLSLYFLFFAKPKHISNSFFGAFLLMLSIRIGKSVFFHFNNELSFHYLQLGLTACFFIGPFLYFYIRSIIKPNENNNKHWKYHLCVLLPIVLVVGFLFPFKYNIYLWRPYIIKTIYLQWFIYILMSLYLVKDRFTKNKREISLNIWLFSILIGNVILVFSYTFSGFVNYISGALTFSFLFYILLLFLFFNKKKRSVIFRKEEKYADKKIDSEQALQQIKRLKVLISEEELYKNANLKSSEIAKKIGLTTHQFSQLLNDNLNKNFSTFINEFRIDCAKRKILSTSHITLEEIGYECGFNSKSTFYTTFKKLAGKTPAQFKSTNL
jgi:AraC-like DNA-binding protein